MKTFSQQEVLDRYGQLPDSVKDALFAEATADKMESIGRKQGLLLDKIGVLAEETGYVMLGLTHPREFTARITEALGVAPMKAQEIAADVSEQVFKPIREHILASERDSEPSAPEQPKSFAPSKNTKSPGNTPFVSSMIFPESAGSKPPTSSDIPSIKKMPLEPSGSWKPPQPITPVFDQMRKTRTQTGGAVEPTSSGADPYHEPIGNTETPPAVKNFVATPPKPKVEPPPVAPPSQSPLERKIPPAPQFIEAVTTQDTSISPAAQKKPVPSTDTIKKEVADILSGKDVALPVVENIPPPPAVIPEPPKKAAQEQPTQPKPEITIKPKLAPETRVNAPSAGEQKPQEQKINVPRYGSNDPYHEPLA